MEPTTEQETRPETKGRVNGVDTDRLFETIDAIKGDPSKASCKFFSTTKWKNGTLSDCEISHYEISGQDVPQNYTIRVDEPEALLGGDNAPNPQMMLYASLAACVLNTFVVNASARGLRLDHVEMDIEGELDLRGFLGISPDVNPGYDELKLVCRVQGDGTREQMQECLDAGTRYSPNFQSISKAVHVKYALDMR